MMLCIKCNKEQPETEYYRSTMRGNNTGECKTCVRDRVTKNRKDKAEYYKEYDRNRGGLPHRVEARKEYAQTEQGKDRLQAGCKAWRKRNPESRKAHNMVNNAIRDGRLHKPSQCESCTNEKTLHGHHCDYNKPLDVMWLCDPCHKKWHKENTPIYHTNE